MWFSFRFEPLLNSVSAASKMSINTKVVKIDSKIIICNRKLKSVTQSIPSYLLYLLKLRYLFVIQIMKFWIFFVLINVNVVHNNTISRSIMSYNGSGNYFFLNSYSTKWKLVMESSSYVLALISALNYPGHFGLLYAGNT